MNLKSRWSVAHLLVVTVSLVMLAGGSELLSQSKMESLPEDRLNPAETSAHIRFLASDELMGRMTGTSGNDVAARYIAEQFRANGVSTVPGAPEYFQVVTIDHMSPPSHGRMILDGDTLTQGSSMIIRSGAAIDRSAPVLFAGYGVVEEGRDDYESLDATGKIVVVRFGLNDSSDVPTGFRAGSSKRSVAAQKGAIAFVELYAGPVPWTSIASFLNRSIHELAAEGRENVATALPHAMVEDLKGARLANIRSETNVTALFSSTGVQLKTLTSHNVVGLIQGSDKRLREEYVVLMAHYDHVGTRRTGSSADTIFNGARDNGMGTVAIINAAKALAESPPARSVLLLAVTAEELGLLGSRYYTEHPLVPLRQTVFVLNSDGAGVSDTSLVTVVGLERTTAEQSIQAGALRYHLTAIPEPVPEQNLFNRSDNVVFARKGVPAPSFSPGFRTFDQVLQKYYHQPEDQADEHFPFAYLHRFSQAFAHAARLIADMPARPRWREGDQYEAAGKSLYGDK